MKMDAFGISSNMPLPFLFTKEGFIGVALKSEGKYAIVDLTSGTFKDEVAEEIIYGIRQSGRYTIYESTDYISALKKLADTTTATRAFMTILGQSTVWEGKRSGLYISFYSEESISSKAVVKCNDIEARYFNVMGVELTDGVYKVTALESGYRVNKEVDTILNNRRVTIVTDAKELAKHQESCCYC